MGAFRPDDLNLDSLASQDSGLSSLESNATVESIMAEGKRYGNLVYSEVRPDTFKSPHNENQWLRQHMWNADDVTWPGVTSRDLLWRYVKFF